MTKEQKKALALIKKYEGFRSKVYLDGNGIRTIGYGFTDPALIRKGKISQAEADARLLKEVLTRLNILRDTLGHDQWDALSSDAKAAFTSYHFNYPGGFKDNTQFMKLWRSGDYTGAINQVDAGMNDLKNPGLRPRRLEEQRMLYGDPYLGGKISVLRTDGGKKMIIPLSAYGEQPKYDSTWKPEQPAKTIYPLNNPTPESISSWSGADAPNATPRLKDFLEVRQEDLNRGIDVNGDPVSPFSLRLRLPSLTSLLQLNSPEELAKQYFADALGISDMLPEGPSLFPRFKNGKLPRFGDGTRLVVGDNGWNRITDSDVANLMENWVATPLGVRNKFDYEYNPNYKQPIGKNVAVRQDNNAWTKQRVAEESNKRSWLSDAADVSHAIGEGAILASNFVPFEGELVSGAKYLSSLAKSYIKHPFYNTVYHGSTYPFDIKNAWIATSDDMGLHVGSKNTALHMSEGGAIYKLRIPKENTTAIDLGRNGVEHFNTNSIYLARPVINQIKGGGPSYDTAIGDDYRLSLLRDAGANPSVIWLDGWIGRLHTENDATLNLLDTEFPNLPKSARQYAKQLNYMMEHAKNGHRNPRDLKWARHLNEQGAKLLSDNGYKVIKYANANPYEVGYGGNGTAYMIMDPSVMDVIENSPKLKPLLYPSANVGFYEYNKNVEGYKDGKSPIHIKPANRGKLTRLKKRTGKSEAELYKTGGLAVRKMITFARNARKWKH